MHITGARMELPLVLILTFLAKSAESQNREHRPTVTLSQGVLIGVKVYPEQSRIAINSFLGIPYAEVPVRFAVPSRHKGWNGSLFAGDFGPICPYRADARGSNENEDCLYLNVWTPEDAMSSSNLPVMVYLVSDESVGDDPVQVPGHDLAAEGVVVITVTYRFNIIGSFCLGTYRSRGNLGILDQYLALLWVKQNAVKFGGDPSKITLMGHGSSAKSVLYHMVSPRTSGLFTRAILMSTSALAPWGQIDPISASLNLAVELGCAAEKDVRRISDLEVMACMRAKPLSEILRVFERQNQNERWKAALWPVVDSFLQEVDRYMPESLEAVVMRGGLLKVPVVTGITDSVTATEQWERTSSLPQDTSQLMQYAEEYVVPSAIKDYQLDGPGAEIIREIMRWRYLRTARGSKEAEELSRKVQQLRWDSRVAAPHATLLTTLVNGSRAPVYTYHLRQDGAEGSTGAVLAGDLVLLFGPALAQRVFRRGFSLSEAHLSRHLKALWTWFSERGAPRRDNVRQDAWRPHGVSQHDVYGLGGPALDWNEWLTRTSFWNELVRKEAALAEVTRTPMAEGTVPRELQHSPDPAAGFRHAVYTLVGLVIALLGLLLVCLVLLKRRAKERNRHFGF